jgi:DNA-binding CsgD family transcriptional regulator
MSDAQHSADESYARIGGPEAVESLVPSGVFRWYPETNEVLWSEGLFSLLGLKPGLATASFQWWLDHIHPEDREQVALNLELLARGGAHPPLDYRMVLNGGRDIYLRSTIFEDHEDGEARSVSGLITDITELAGAKRERDALDAVATALSEWGVFEPSAARLLESLANALQFDLGVLWVPQEGALYPAVVWHNGLIGEEVGAAIRGLRLIRGMGLAGEVWTSRVPGNVVNLLDDPRFEPSHPLARAKLGAVLGIPLLGAAEVVSVLSFVAREPTELTHSMLSTLTRIGSQLGTFISRRRHPFAAPPALTKREHEVLQLAADGHSAGEIATRLNLSPATIKTHLENTYRKLGVHDRTSAVAETIRQGLIR